MKLTLIKGDKLGSDTDYRDALPENMYAVKKEILGAAGYLLNYDGLTQIATGFGIDRGGFYNENFEEQYRVSGTKFISIDDEFNVTEIGDVAGSDQAILEDLYSPNTQGIIANNRFYLYNGVSTFTEVTDPDLGDPIDGVWINGVYFLTDGTYVYHTDVGDETSIDPLKYSTADFMPDPVKGVAKTQDNKVIVFGRFSLEFFVYDATSDFSFTRIETRAQKIGIVSTHGKCETRENFYILGGRRREAIGVHAIGLGTTTKVSNREIDKIIAEYPEDRLFDAKLESRVQNDTVFVLLHLPDYVLCFNETIASTLGKDFAWSLLKSKEETSPYDDMVYRAVNGVYDPRSNAWVYGDKNGTRIGKLDSSVSTQYGELVEWVLYTPLVLMESLSIDEIELKTIPGHTTEAVTTLAVSLTYDGVIFGSEIWLDYGEKYNYNKRLIAGPFGYCNEKVGFKFRGLSLGRVAFGLLNLKVS